MAKFKVVPTVVPKGKIENPNMREYAGGRNRQGVPAADKSVELVEGEMDGIQNVEIKPEPSTAEKAKK